MRIGNHDTHPAADVFPLMDDGALAELAESIDRNGLRRKPVLLDGQILDGRHRYKATLIVNERRAKRGDDLIVLEFDEYTGPTDKTSIANYVWDLNGARRDMGLVARAMVARRLNAWSRERKERSKNQPVLPAVVSHEVAQAVDVVMADGCDELKAAFQSGDVPPDVAMRLATELEPDDQREVLEKWFAPVVEKKPANDNVMSVALALSENDLRCAHELIGLGEKTGGIYRAGAALLRKMVGRV